MMSAHYPDDGPPPGWGDGYVEFVGSCPCPNCNGTSRSHDNKNGYTCMECGSKEVGA